MSKDKQYQPPKSFEQEYESFKSGTNKKASSAYTWLYDSLQNRYVKGAIYIGSAAAITYGLYKGYTYITNRYEQDMGKNAKHLKDFYLEFHLKDQNHELVKADFQKQVVSGNQGQMENCSMKMLPSFISKLPQGNEVGDFFAIDIGGTNMRVLQVKLQGQREKRQYSYNKVEIPYEVYTGKNDDFYTWIANQFIDFTQQLNYEKDFFYKIGFCFSFPTTNTSQKHARLLEWTKEFKIEGGMDKNLDVYLTDALKKQGLRNVSVTCVMNDTVAVFAASHFFYPNLEIGIVMGTGTNACYMELTKNITKIQDSKHFKTAKKDELTVVNLEWAFFKSQYLPTSREDKEIDKESDAPGKSTFEKRIASKYLGQLTRKVFLRMISLRRQNQNSEYSEDLIQKIKRNTSFDAIMVTKIVSEYPTSSRKIARKLLHECFNLIETEIDSELVEDLQRACLWTCERSAELLGTAMAALVEHVAEYQKPNSDIEVVIEGSMYEMVKFYQKICQKYFNKYLNIDPKKRISVSIKGTNELAAMGGALLACQYADQ